MGRDVKFDGFGVGGERTQGEDRAEKEPRRKAEGHGDEGKGARDAARAPRPRGRKQGKDSGLGAEAHPYNAARIGAHAELGMNLDDEIEKAGEVVEAVAAA